MIYQRRSVSRFHRKPHRDRDKGENDRSPHHWRNSFRAAASRRIVGGVVEFTIHLGTVGDVLEQGG
jgi:hypothetical protein